jgi:Ricin-type beta-trefoil lectin domain
MTRLDRGQRRPDDAGSMAILLIVTIVGLMLSALLVPVIVNMDRSTRFDTSRVMALDAAQAGIDVALGQIRAAVSGSIGDSGKLPCGPLSGTVNDVGGQAYSVTIEYFVTDPVANPTAAKMLCSSGYGTYDTTSSAVTPSYARLTSSGTVGTAVNASTGGRTLVSTYVFKTANTNVAGGVIRIYPASSTSPSLCMDAGSATPSAGTGVVLQACSTTTPPLAQQVFIYRADLTIELRYSVTATYPDGLCLDTSAPPTAANTIVLAACQPLGTTPPYTQQWSFNDSGAYQASLSTSRSNGALGPPNLCMNVTGQTAGLPVVLATCDGNVSSPAQAWIPAPSVGAGAATEPQWVNYLEFGRCLDVTGQNVSASHLIDYPCKQNPYAGAVTWNQKFTPPTIANGQGSATGQFYTTTRGTDYCLTSPASQGGYVTVQVCGTSNASQQWTVSNGNKTLPYSVKYTIVDSTGLCLGLTSPVSGEQWSAIDVETCDGSTEQKWNANPNLSAPILQNTREI